jgi:general secretion pathway protein C
VSAWAWRGLRRRGVQHGRQRLKAADLSQWKARALDRSARVRRQLLGLWRYFADSEERLTQLQQALIILLALWSLISVSQLLWIPWRGGAIEPAPSAAIHAPVARSGEEVVRVDVSSVLGSGVFGAEEGVEDGVGGTGDSVSAGRDGIEQGARETQLALKLTGIVASTENGLGSAVIDTGGREQVFAVGDALPASGRVVLAKVMPEQVVIDNNGTYELIRLYDGQTVTGIKTTRGQAARPSQTGNTEPLDSDGKDRTAENPSSSERTEEDAARSEVARRYRRELYDDPASLAELVSVSPVRDSTGIVGYRLSPGTDPEAFNTLGFQDGDMLVAVNGMALSDSSSAIKLYQQMKEATEVTFDVERDGARVAVNVNLGGP